MTNLPVKDEVTDTSPVDESEPPQHIQISLNGSTYYCDPKQPKETELLMSAEHGDIATIAWLLVGEGFNVNIANSMGQTLVSLAARNGHWNAVSFLLQYKADPHTTDIQRRTPLSHAAENGHESVVRLLLKHVDEDTRDFSWKTALAYAAENGHEEVARLLLEARSPPNSKDFYRCQTPLFHAARGGHLATVRLLLEHGADPKIQDIDRQSPIFYAVKSGYETVVRFLLQYETDPESKDVDCHTSTSDIGNDMAEPAHSFHDIYPDSKDSWGRTPLSYAALTGNETIVRLLLGKGADRNAKDLDYKTPLHHAQERHHKAVVCLLQEHGAHRDTHVMPTSDADKNRIKLLLGNYRSQAPLHF